jgi:hypothetical protein
LGIVCAHGSTSIRHHTSNGTAKIDQFGETVIVRLPCSSEPRGGIQDMEIGDTLRLHAAK